MATTQIPLINNLANPVYMGLVARLGETPAHLAKRPTLAKINNKKILYLCVGASTPAQISTAFVKSCAVLKNVKVLNCCMGAQDINDWLNFDGAAFSNLEDIVLANGYTLDEVQGIIMCHDDLKDQSTAFPSAPQSLSNLMETFITRLKTEKMPNLKTVDLFSRFYEGWITDPKFQTPSGYNNGWSCKFLTEKAIANGGFISGVWISDGNGYFYTDGETVRSDGFYVKKSEFKQKGTSVHINTATQLDERAATQLFNGMKRYPDFN
jgi:hypothetical protein